MNDYINKLSCWYVGHGTKKLLVRSSTSVGSDVSYFHKQTELTLIRQLLQELPDPGLFCFAIAFKGFSIRSMVNFAPKNTKRAWMEYIGQRLFAIFYID